MKKLVFIGVIALFLASCGSGPKKQDQTSAAEAEAVPVVLTVDQLYENVAENLDKEVLVKGTVMHVCQHGGQRCFLMGSTEDINIRIEAGEKIGSFSQELMGSELEIAGVLREVKTEADAHNPGEHEGDAEAEEDSVTVKAHQVIAESQEKAEIVYFIEGLKINEKL